MITELCQILFDNKSVDDSFSVFHSQTLFSVEDAKIFQNFAQNKYLQKHFLLRHLQNLRLPAWLTLCDILLKVKSMERTAIQLLNGELFMYLCVCM